MNELGLRANLESLEASPCVSVVRRLSMRLEDIILGILQPVQREFCLGVSRKHHKLQISVNLSGIHFCALPARAPLEQLYLCVGCHSCVGSVRPNLEVVRSLRGLASRSVCARRALRRAVGDPQREGCETSHPMLHLNITQPLNKSTQNNPCGALICAF